MKKHLILLAAVALMAMVSCNSKYDKADKSNAPATEQQATQQASQDSTSAKPKVSLESPKPTADGKDKLLADVTDAKGAHVTIINQADGSLHLQMWEAGKDKSGKPLYDIVAKSEMCRMTADAYVLQSEDGTSFTITTKEGAESINVIKGNQLVYSTLK